MQKHWTTIARVLAFLGIVLAVGWFGLDPSRWLASDAKRADEQAQRSTPELLLILRVATFGDPSSQATILERCHELHEVFAEASPSLRRETRELAESAIELLHHADLAGGLLRSGFEYPRRSTNDLEELCPLAIRLLASKDAGRQLLKDVDWHLEQSAILAKNEHLAPPAPTPEQWIQINEQFDRIRESNRERRLELLDRIVPR